MARAKNTKDTFYLITYKDAESGDVISLKAEEVGDSTLGLGFVCISGFIFNLEGLVVNPTEEHLSRKFDNIKSLHLAVYSIISIEEVGMEHKGLNFRRDKSNLVMFPQDSPLK